MAEFDPYYHWLGIPPEDQPANAYQLLGVKLFESNRDAISNAADGRMAIIRTFQNGAQQSLLAAHSQRVVAGAGHAAGRRTKEVLRPQAEARNRAREGRTRKAPTGPPAPAGREEEKSRAQQG